MNLNQYTFQKWHQHRYSIQNTSLYYVLFVVEHTRYKCKGTAIYYVY